LYFLWNNWFCDAKPYISLGIIGFVMPSLVLVVLEGLMAMAGLAGPAFLEVSEGYSGYVPPPAVIIK